MAHKYVRIGGTVSFPFALNDTAGSGADGSAPVFKVRKVGDAAGAAPMFSGTPTLLSDSAYPDGSYEIVIVASVGNGFVDGASYEIYSKATVSGQNPSGCAGSFDIQPVISDVWLTKGADYDPAADVPIDLTQVVPMRDVSADVNVTVGSALLSGRAQGAGSWIKSGSLLTLFNPDGSIFRTFTLDAATNPNSRT